MTYEVYQLSRVHFGYQGQPFQQAILTFIFQPSEIPSLTTCSSIRNN
jgi:hypothetical protein